MQWRKQQHAVTVKFQEFEFFIELSRIKKCFTQKGGIFVLEEFDPKTRKVIQRKYKSSMENFIALAFHRIISVQTILYVPPKRVSSEPSIDPIAEEQTIIKKIVYDSADDAASCSDSTEILSRQSSVGTFQSE